MSNYQSFTGDDLGLSSLHDHRNYQDYKNFELLYDEYAPKAFGFIVSYTNSKEKAEEYLGKVFLKVWQEIKTLDEQTEKKFIKILLLTCRPIYIKK